MISPGVFRLLLATLVVLAHFTKLGLGTAAVNLFFILSGFWVYRMFSTKYERSRHPGLLFMASRMLRIFPVFLLFNGCAFLLHLTLRDQTAYGQSLTDIIPNTLIIGYSSLTFRPLGPAWSLDMELQFYLLFPMIFTVTAALSKYSKMILIWTLGLGGVYVSLFIDGDVGSATVFPYTGLFLLGTFAARSNWRPSLSLARWSALATVCGLAIMVALPSLRGFVIHSIDEGKFAWNPAINFLVALVAAPVALSSVYTRSTSRDRLLGDLSYVVYCSHWLAVIVAVNFVNNADKVSKGIVVLGMISVVYLVSLLVLLYFDRPIGRWREAWIDGKLNPGDGPIALAKIHGNQSRIR